NQELEIYLRIFCQNQLHSWPKYLTTAEFCHNQRPHSTNNQSPVTTKSLLLWRTTRTHYRGDDDDDDEGVVTP
ncbi:hypothetical protein SERLADRAFT_353185, partial [Serpula lacrymans var. lacrymans S7.9]